MKKLMIEQKERIEQVKESITKNKKYIEEFVSKTNGLPIGKIINSSEDLITMLNNPSSGIAGIIKSRIPDTEFGVPVNKEEKFRLLTLPDLTEISEHSQLIRNTAGSYGINYLDGLYELEGDKVKINIQKMEGCLDRYRTYATSNEEANFLDLQGDFLKAFIKLKEHAGSMVGANNVRERFNPATFEICKFINSDLTLNPQSFEEIKQVINTIRG